MFFKEFAMQTTSGRCRFLWGNYYKERRPYFLCFCHPCHESKNKASSFLRFSHPGVFQLGLGARFSIIWYLASHKVDLAILLKKIDHLASKNLLSGISVLNPFSTQVVNHRLPTDQISQVGIWRAERDSVAGARICFTTNNIWNFWKFYPRCEWRPIWAFHLQQGQRT